MIGLIVALVVVAVIAVSIYASKVVKHPEQIAVQEGPDATTTSDQLYGSSDRPAGPDVDDFVSADEQPEADGAIRSAGAPVEEHGSAPR